MKASLLLGLCLVLPAFPVNSGNSPVDRTPLLPRLWAYVAARSHEFSEIPHERKVLLRKLAQYVRGQTQPGSAAQLTFICTHNSRRSHLSQIWGAIAASYYGVGGVQTYSGGTEATAFNPRAVAALERAGLTIKKLDEEQNPRYEVRFNVDGDPLVCFSKVYGDAANPQSDYCAVMTCSEADQGCPAVLGAAFRMALPYDDPKVADDTVRERSIYDERCRQIAREMLYLFSEVAS